MHPQTRKLVREAIETNLQKLVKECKNLGITYSLTEGTDILGIEVSIIHEKPSPEGKEPITFEEVTSATINLKNIDELELNKIDYIYDLVIEQYPF